MITVGQALGAPLAGLLVEHTGVTRAFRAFATLGAIATLLAPTKHFHPLPSR